MERPVTLKEVAAKAGVSMMAVSKALRGFPDISPERKKELRALAKKMGYQPNKGARSMASLRRTWAPPKAKKAKAPATRR